MQLADQLARTNPMGEESPVPCTWLWRATKHMGTWREQDSRSECCTMAGAAQMWVFFWEAPVWRFRMVRKEKSASHQPENVQLGPSSSKKIQGLWDEGVLGLKDCLCLNFPLLSQSNFCQTSLGSDFIVVNCRSQKRDKRDLLQRQN